MSQFTEGRLCPSVPCQRLRHSLGEGLKATGIFQGYVNLRNGNVNLMAWYNGGTYVSKT